MFFMSCAIVALLSLFLSFLCFGLLVQTRSNKFLSKLKHLYFMQVAVVFKVGGLINLYIKELKNDIQYILFSTYSIYYNLLSGIIYLYQCSRKGLGGSIIKLLLVIKFIGLLLQEFLQFFKIKVIFIFIYLLLVLFQYLLYTYTYQNGFSITTLFF